MFEARTRDDSTTLAAVSSAIVKLHKQQFGRGPTHARTDYAGRDLLVCTLEDALLPAERALVEMGEGQRVMESRALLQSASAKLFVATIEEIVGRNVRAFSSAVDPPTGLVYELFAFEPA